MSWIQIWSSVQQTHAVQLVASFGVKPQLCQLKLKTTHGPKQDIKKRVHSSLTSTVRPMVGVYCVQFSVKETDLTTLCNCFVESGRGCFLLGTHGYCLKRLHFVCKCSNLFRDIIYIFVTDFCRWRLLWPSWEKSFLFFSLIGRREKMEIKQTGFLQTIIVCHVYHAMKNPSLIKERSQSEK